jgi:hypothetical protein
MLGRKVSDDRQRRKFSRAQLGEVLGVRSFDVFPGIEIDLAN